MTQSISSRKRLENKLIFLTTLLNKTDDSTGLDRLHLGCDCWAGVKTGEDGKNGSISHGETLSGLWTVVGSSCWTCTVLHLEAGYCKDRSPIPTMVPVNIHSGDSSPSNLILIWVPRENQCFIASIYLLTPTMNWLILKNTNASPATSLFEDTNVLQPVVRKCLLGCSKQNKKKQLSCLI